MINHFFLPQITFDFHPHPWSRWHVGKRHFWCERKKWEKIDLWKLFCSILNLSSCRGSDELFPVIDYQCRNYVGWLFRASNFILILNRVCNLFNLVKNCKLFIICCKFYDNLKFCIYFFMLQGKFAIQSLGTFVSEKLSGR